MNDDETSEQELIKFYNEDKEINGEVYPRYVWVETIGIKMVNIAYELQTQANVCKKKGSNIDQVMAESLLKSVEQIVSDVRFATAAAHSNILPACERRKMLPPMLRIAGYLEPYTGKQGRSASGQTIARAFVNMDRVAYEPLMDAAMQLFALSQIYECDGWLNIKMEVGDIPDPIPNERLAELAKYESDNKGNAVSKIMRSALKSACEANGVATLDRWHHEGGEHGLAWTHKDFFLACPFMRDTTKLKKFLKLNGFDPSKQPLDQPSNPPSGEKPVDLAT